jgi:hypothetical protein
MLPTSNYALRHSFDTPRTGAAQNADQSPRRFLRLLYCLQIKTSHNNNPSNDINGRIVETGRPPWHTLLTAVVGVSEYPIWTDPGMGEHARALALPIVEQALHVCVRSTIHATVDLTLRGPHNEEDINIDVLPKYCVDLLSGAQQLAAFGDSAPTAVVYIIKQFLDADMNTNTSTAVCSERGALQDVDFKKSSDSDEDVTHSSPYLASPLPDITTLCATIPPRSPTKHPKHARKTKKAVYRTNSLAISAYTQAPTMVVPETQSVIPVGPPIPPPSENGLIRVEYPPNSTVQTPPSLQTTKRPHRLFASMKAKQQKREYALLSLQCAESPHSSGAIIQQHARKKATETDEQRAETGDSDGEIKPRGELTMLQPSLYSTKTPIPTAEQQNGEDG